MSLLYLLVSQDGSAFKIGVSRNPVIRAAQLPIAINYERSLELEFCSGSAVKTERALHYLFREHRRPMPKGDGYTEWFRIQALAGVLGLIEREGKAFGVKEMRSIAPQIDDQEVASIRERTKAAKNDARRARQEKRKASYVETLVDAKDHNTTELCRLKQILGEFDARGLEVGRCSKNRLYILGEGSGDAVRDLVFANITVSSASGWDRVFYGGYCADGKASTAISERVMESTLPEDEFPGAEAIGGHLRSLSSFPVQPHIPNLMLWSDLLPALS